MAKTAYSRLLHKPNSCTIPQETRHAHLCSELYSTSEHHIHTHLLSTCIQQCKQIQSRRLFDEIPKRLSLASKTSKVVHSQSLKLGIGPQGRLGNAIVELYAKCGNIEFAEKAFHRLECVDLCAWNSVLSLYSRQGWLDQAIWHFGSMRNCRVGPNQYTFAVLLSVCGRLMDAKFGKQVHCNVFKAGFEFNSFCEGSLIDLYAKPNNVIDASRIFDAAEEPDTVSWTAIIDGYVQAGLPEEAIKLFKDMQNMRNAGVSWNAIIVGYVHDEKEDEAFKLFERMTSDGITPDEVSLASILSACANLQALDRGKLLDCLSVKYGLETSLYAGSSLIDMYAKCGAITTAYEVFISMPERSVISANALIAGYAQHNLEKAVYLLHDTLAEGLKPSEITFACLLDACTGPSILNLGRLIHCFVLKAGLAYEDDFFSISLLGMYMCSQGKIDANILFSELPNP